MNLYEYKIDSITRKSDFIRLELLSKYGGIWMDASIICKYSLNWIHAYQKNTDAEMVGYYINGFTTIEKYPVVENWFISCIPKSRFIELWKIK